MRSNPRQEPDSTRKQHTHKDSGASNRGPALTSLCALVRSCGPIMGPAPVSKLPWSGGSLLVRIQDDMVKNGFIDCRRSL